MSDCDFTDLEFLLEEVWKYAIQTKEATLFAVGGRGYYEDPASDLLAFFLKPDEVHGLGLLFLSTFLECMKEDLCQFNTLNVDIRREVQTSDGNYIDLRILSPDWCLLIENKIRHWDANPFKDYEAHAKRLRKRTIFSILSPDGHSNNGWIGVSYSAYCKALWEKMPELASYPPLSKWHLFAREFILHMENELNNPPMTREQVSFVEKHEDQIAEVQKLAAQYRLFIRQELEKNLGIHFDISEHTWPGFRLVYYCTPPQWSNGNVVLFKGEGPGQKFFIRAYLGDVSEPLLSNVKCALEHMEYNNEDQEPFWTSPRPGFDSREEAINELCKLAKIVDSSRNSQKIL